MNAAVTKKTAIKPVPALTSFTALIERPLAGGADRVLRIVPATERASLLKEALALNAPGLREGYTVEDCAVFVLRQGGSQRHARWEGQLALYTSQGEAEAARDRIEASEGVDLVIEQLSDQVAERYPRWRVMA